MCFSRICILLCLIWPCASASAAEPAGKVGTIWARAGADLEIAEVPISSRLVFSTQLTLVRTALARYRVGVVSASEFGLKRSDVRSLVNAAKAVAGINANFFDEQGSPLGLVVSRGIQQQKIHWGGSTLTGIFFATRKQIAIVPRKSFVAHDVLEAVQAGPRLLSNGSPVPGLRESLAPSKRAGICIDNAARLLFFAVSSRLVGLDAEELQAVLRRKDINCIHALNFDGGGSAQLYVSGKLPGAVLKHEYYVSGEDQIPVILALFPR